MQLCLNVARSRQKSGRGILGWLSYELIDIDEENDLEYYGIGFLQRKKALRQSAYMSVWTNKPACGTVALNVQKVTYTCADMNQVVLGIFRIQRDILQLEIEFTRVSKQIKSGGNLHR